MLGGTSAALVQRGPPHLGGDDQGGVLVQVCQALALLPPDGEHLQPLAGGEPAHLAAHLAAAGNPATSSGLAVGSVHSASGDELLGQRGELGLEVGVGELASLCTSRGHHGAVVVPHARAEQVA